MARGDAVRLIHIINSTGYTYITPASGDEFFIMRVSVNAAHTLTLTPDNGSNWYQMFGSQKGDSAVTMNAHAAGWCSTDVKWYLTPTFRLRLYR